MTTDDKSRQPPNRIVTLALLEIIRSLIHFACHPGEVTRESAASLASMFGQVMAALGIDDAPALWAHIISVLEPDSPLRKILEEAASQELHTVHATIYDEAFAEGFAAGKLEGMVRFLLRLLDKRRLTLTEPQRQRVEACTDEAQLLDWFDRALTASRTNEVFDSTG